MPSQTSVIRLLPDWRGARRDPDALYEALRAAIVRLEYKPGEAIYENVIAQRSGLSRTPVRDALKRLRDEGLVEIRAGAGSFVARIDVHRLQQAITMRSLIEGEAAAAAARDARAPVLYATLGVIIEAQRAAIAAGDLDGMYQLDSQFHEAFFAFRNLGMMWGVVRTARAEMDRIHHVARSNPDRPRLAAHAHQTIADAVNRREPDSARAIMIEHIQSNSAYLLDIAAKHPEYLRPA